MTGDLVIIGDVLLDADIDGFADRICPDAPVPVVDVRAHTRRPGGAGLAAVLAAESADRVVIITAFADDDAGRELRSMLSAYAEVHAIELHGETVCKTRVRARGQSVVRFDSGNGTATQDELPPGARIAIENAGAILVADYGRGMAANPSVRQLISECAGLTPIVWDPHPRGPAPVAGVTLVTPNRAEAAQFAAGATVSDPSSSAGNDADSHAQILAQHWEAENVVVTRGADAALHFSSKTSTTSAVEVLQMPASGQLDTCGAGDRFASAAAEALRRGENVDRAVAYATEQATRYVHAGAVSGVSLRLPVTTPAEAQDPFEFAARVRARGGKLVATGGCFDLLHPGHLSLLRHARSLGDALIVCLNSDRSVRRAKGEGRPVVTETDRARLLLELESVDAVAIFDEATPTAVLDGLRPAVWVKGSDYAGADLPEAPTVQRHGGEVVFAPVLDGYSTTRLVAAARAIA